MGAIIKPLAIPVSPAVDRGIQTLLREQMQDGSWNGRFLPSISTTALYVLLKERINQRDDRFARAINWLVEQQNPSGGWGDRRGMPDDPAKSRTCLKALRAGLPEDHPGVTAAARYTAGCGQIKDVAVWEAAMAFWGVSGDGRGYRSVAPLPALYWLANHGPVNPFIRILLNVDLLMALQVYKRTGRFRPWHRALERKVLAVVLRDRQGEGPFAGAWQGTPATTIDAIGALVDIGYAADSPLIQESLRFVEDWQVSEGGIGLTSSMNIWESCLAGLVLQASGRPVEGPLQRLLDFLERSMLPEGAWPWDSRMAKWAYYDTDDTAYSALALWRGGRRTAIEPVIAFLRRQQVGGGWSTMNRKPIITVNPLLGNCLDVTAHAVSFLVEACGRDSTEVQSAVRWILKQRQRDGSWIASWAVRKTYGIHCAVEGLIGAGVADSHPAIQSAASWLRHHQNADGGWGEDWDGNRAPSTIEQTAFAVHALAVAGELPESAEIQRGIRFLLDMQNPDGSWTPGQVGCFQDQFSGYYNIENYATIHALNALIAVERRLAGLPALYTSKLSRAGR